MVLNNESKRLSPDGATCSIPAPICREADTLGCRHYHSR